jgi:protein-histidine pros-kinase
MAVHTTAGLFIISIGTSLINSDKGLVKLFTGNLIGNAMARKLFPQVLIVGLVLTFLRIATHRYNLVSVEFGIALFGVSFILVILFLLGRASKELNKIDIKRAKAEDNLVKIETFLNTTPDPIVIIDEEAVIQLVNHQAMKVFGYDKSELVGKPIELLLSQRFMKKQKDLRNAFFSLTHVDELMPSLELSALKKNHNEFPVEISLSPIHLGHVTWVSVAVRDITERKSVEARLKEYQFFFNNSMDFSCIANTEGYFEVINPNFEKYLGYTSKELVSDQFLSFVHPDDKEATIKEIEKLASGAITINFVNRYRKKDGSYLWLDWNTQPNPSTGKLYAIARDITDRKRSEEKFRGLLESAPDSIVIVNQAGTIELVNAQTEKLFGYDRSELVGVSVDVLLPDRHRRNHQNNALAYFFDPKSRVMGKGLELSGMKKDQSEFPVEISLSPLETEHGTWFSAAVRDVTDRKRFEQAIQEANRLKSEFLANMSHELRTPLNGIIGFSEFLIDKKAGMLNEKQQEYLNDILNSGTHLLHLINDILDLSKIESGKMELFRETFSLKEAIGEVCSVISGISKKKNINLKVDIEGNAENVSADKQKFKQILYNLISNAVKFTNNNGKVEVIAQTDNGDLSIQVRDDGIGISAEGINRLFMPFVQLDSSVSRKHEGTGLGLSLTKRMVELHGGSISVRSEPGRGSTFTAVLPQSIFKIDKQLRKNHESLHTDR